MRVSTACVGSGPLSLEQHLLVLMWTYYWFDRSPGKAALWANDTACMKPGSQKTPLLSLGYGICSSTMCVYLCLCSKSTVDKISTKARGMRIKQAPHTRDTSDA